MRLASILLTSIPLVCTGGFALQDQGNLRGTNTTRRQMQFGLRIVS